MIIIPFPQKNVYSLAGSAPPLSHLISCTPTSVKSCKAHSQPPNWGTNLVGCPRLLIQYIRSCLPQVEAVCSIRNLRACHYLATKYPTNVYNII
jgi:hypothetical protein